MEESYEADYDEAGEDVCDDGEMPSGLSQELPQERQRTETEQAVAADRRRRVATTKRYAATKRRRTEVVEPQPMHESESDDDREGVWAEDDVWATLAD